MRGLRSVRLVSLNASDPWVCPVGVLGGPANPGRSGAVRGTNRGTQLSAQMIMVLQETAIDRGATAASPRRHDCVDRSQRGGFGTPNLKDAACPGMATGAALESKSHNNKCAYGSSSLIILARVVRSSLIISSGSRRTT